MSTPRNIIRIALLALAVFLAGCQSQQANPPGDATASAPSTMAEPSKPAQADARDEAEPPRATPPRATTPTDTASDASTIATPFPGIRVHVNNKRVELDGKACLDAGWLEFIACSPNTKEHESLVVLSQRPSNIHAAMLLAGFEAGHPGAWTYENEQFELIPPEGSRVRILARYTDADGKIVTENICTWIRDHLGNEQFPCKPWVFGGSTFQANPEFMGEGEHYVADMTGSVIGLATFGDELIGYSTVISHDSSVHAPEWEVDTDAVPPVGTDVTLIIEPHE